LKPAFEALGIGSTYLGPTAQATTAVFISVLALAFPGPYAISLAASIRIGNLLGAGKPNRAREAASAAHKIALVLVLGAAGCLLLLRKYVALFYTVDDRVLEMVHNNVSASVQNRPTPAESYS
jgi:MATE family multidrug resistance protein